MATSLARSSTMTNMGRGRLAVVLTGLLLGILLSALDQTVVGTAMPRVIAELGGMQHYAWVFTAYMLASTVTVPMYGKLSDLYGRRRFFLIGMVLFLLGSALSGASQDLTQLIVFRAIQGLGAGAMMPIVQAIVGDLFPPRQRGKWQGLMMASLGLASIVGPPLGGFITDNWGWRWVFYVNMPIGLAALLATGLAMPGFSRHQEHRVDYLGAALLVAATVPLLLAFSWAGSEYPWGSVEIIGLVAFAIVMTGLFLVVESRATEPIISPGLFRNRIFLVSVAASFLASVGMFGSIMYLPLFVQGVLGQTASGSGLVLTPMMLGFVASSIVGGQVLARTGRYKLMAIGGFVLAAAGMLLLAMMDTRVDPSVIARNMVVVGVGIGGMMSLFTIVVQNVFPLSQLGQVTATLHFFRSIGGTVGVAILGSIMTNRFQAAFQANLPETARQAVPPERLIAAQNPQLLLAPGAADQMGNAFASLGPQGAELLAQVMDTIRSSLGTALTDVFAVGTGVMALGCVVTLFLREVPLRKSHDLPTPEVFGVPVDREGSTPITLLASDEVHAGYRPSPREPGPRPGTGRAGA